RRRICGEPPAQGAPRSRCRRRPRRQGGRGDHGRGQDRADRRRQDLRHLDRPGGAHPHRRNRQRRAVSAAITSRGTFMTGRRLADRIVSARGAAGALAALLLSAVPALAQGDTGKIDAGDTTWMISATGLVLMMTIPGLALFYCGMVRKKNVLATMAQCLLCVGMCSVLWAVVGYRLTFNGDGALIGNLDKAMLMGIGIDTVAPATRIPEILFMLYQMTFAVIT